MNRTYSQHAQTLPRIRSTGKFTRAITQLTDKPKNEQSNRSEEKRALTRLSSQRKNLQSANASKTVRYEATNAIYLKKIEVLQKQSMMLDKEISLVNEDISQFRLKKKNIDDSKSVISKASIVSKSSLVNEPGLSRLQAMRKKADKQIFKNKQSQIEIDKVRKEIITTKKLNDQLFSELKIISQKLAHESNKSIKLQQQIANKRQDLKRKKIQAIHQKTHLIKNYDAILKKLDQDLASNPISQSRALNNNLYLTDVYLGTNQRKKNREYTENSPKAKRNAAQITHFKQQIENYQKRFQQLKLVTNCQSTQEALQKFSEQYEKNFSYYQFINQRFAQLEQVKAKNIQLINKKMQIENNLEACSTSRSARDLKNMQDRIIEVNIEKDNLRQKIHECELLFSRLKKFVEQGIKKYPLQKLKAKYEITQLSDLNQIITRQNLQQFLDQILIVNRRTSKQPSIQKSSVNQTLQECLQQAKKQGMHQKQRLLGRQQLLSAGRKFTKIKNFRN